MFIYVKSLIASHECREWRTLFIPPRVALETLRWLVDNKSQLITLNTFKASCHARAICFCRENQPYLGVAEVFLQPVEPVTASHGQGSRDSCGFNIPKFVISFLSPVSLLAKVLNIRTVHSLVLTSSNTHSNSLGAWSIPGKTRNLITCKD